MVSPVQDLGTGIKGLMCGLDSKQSFLYLINTTITMDDHLRISPYGPYGLIRWHNGRAVIISGLNHNSVQIHKLLDVKCLITA